jgi:hypothetical protein
MSEEQIKKIELTLKLAKYWTYADEMTEGEKKYLRDAIDDALKQVKNTVNLDVVVGRSEQLKCVDNKHYTGITKGKTYQIFKNPDGFNYPHKKLIHITNDLGFVRAYYRSCFEAF